jgi:lactoylglutathione lyase
VILDFDHVHLTAPDQGAASQWYIDHLGARVGPAADRVVVGDRLLLIFYKGDGARPSRDGFIDRIGFSVPNVDRVAAAIVKNGGAAMANGDRRPFATALVEDPWGARLELVDDPAARGLHHVHLMAPDPVETLGWFAETFGGQRRTFGSDREAVLCGSVWLLADRGTSAPSAGHAIDHIAWRTDDLDRAAARLKADRVPFTMEPRDFNPTTRISFVEGPAGIRIEVLERK